METKDQKFFWVGGQPKAEIDICITREHGSAPLPTQCRHAVLPLRNGGYVVYDRLLCRIVNGVFRGPEDALRTARYYNEDPNASQDRSPNGLALGLLYPEIEEII